MATLIHGLPHIFNIDNTIKFEQIVNEENKVARKYKILAYANQLGLIDYNRVMTCPEGYDQRQV